MLRSTMLGFLVFGLVLTFSHAGFAQDDPDLIIYFDYEAMDNGIVPDMSGYGHKGTVNGDVTLVDGGKKGKAAQFQGGGFLDLDGPNMPAEQIPRDAMTVAAWVKCENSGGDHAIFNARASDSTWVVHPELKSAGDFRWLLRTDGGVTIFDMRAGIVAWGTWMHYAGVYDRTGDAILYIDGEEVGRQAGGATIAEDWGQGARVGKNIDDARPFTGLMDDLTIYKRALTQEDIQVQMEFGPPLLQPVAPRDKLAITWGSLKHP